MRDVRRGKALVGQLVIYELLSFIIRTQKNLAACIKIYCVNAQAGSLQSVGEERLAGRAGKGTHALSKKKKNAKCKRECPTKIAPDFQFSHLFNQHSTMSSHHDIFI